MENAMKLNHTITPLEFTPDMLLGLDIAEDLQSPDQM